MKTTDDELRFIRYTGDACRLLFDGKPCLALATHGNAATQLPIFIGEHHMLPAGCGPHVKENPGKSSRLHRPKSS
ncbi:bsr3580 [Bradyrhizobium diazoefficiens USDA 110]|uniref:Bsr3580 protein n=1 Tax=Bradyrhizobium diazoefficiens (strain JCM 10833 / BCRC 13528 / IAM 13628 / NBRC 14792 / USDA 110) TaxID=224911 RepID=Q89PA2_BRADU|nr:hypothetical protein CO678_17700 [Bradyrhizobium diazoefficiens]QBP22357.1 hypothetical protein Bdiaspc4_18490 [Bradyrhizobium diazoefficiens]QHP71395.1 hypothetical protein EI171_31475 [Bradyrhizobium sp. LCT2]BAC48845.1 bsr3580 [Bradyrhizobium diazoefficiens USDA 110]